MTLSPAKAALLHVLCFKVRRLTFWQIAALCALYGVMSEECVRRVVRQLMAAGLLLYKDVLAKPLLPLDAPIFVYPDDGEPDFQALAWILEKRWTKAVLEQTRIYFASPKCGRILGGVTKGKITTQAQLSHDLHVSQLFIRLSQTDPKIAAGWVHEDELESSYRPGEARPDAIIFDGQKPILALEFGGEYGPLKLRQQHFGCIEKNLPYELH